MARRSLQEEGGEEEEVEVCGRICPAQWFRPRGGASPPPSARLPPTSCSMGKTVSNS